VQKGQLSAHQAPHQLAFHWPYRCCMQMDAACTKKLAQTPRRRPLSAPLSLRPDSFCLLRYEPGLSSPGTTRTTHTMLLLLLLLLLLLWYHAGYHGMSRGGLPVVIMPRAFFTTAASSCAPLPDGNIHATTVCSRANQSTAKPCSMQVCASQACLYRQYRYRTGRLGTRLTTRQGNRTWPLAALCALQACQGCLVGAAMTRSFIPMRACACMPPCVAAA
jgi:hypothetical protein